MMYTLAHDAGAQKKQENTYMLMSIAATADASPIIVWGVILTLVFLATWAALFRPQVTQVVQPSAPPQKVMTPEDRARIAVDVAEANAFTREDGSAAAELVEMIQRKSPLVETSRMGVRLVMAEIVARKWPDEDVARVGTEFLKIAA